MKTHPMKKLLQILSLLSLLTALTFANEQTNLTSNQTFSPSFDCSKATLEVEKMICQDEELSKLDNEMAKAYQHMLSISNEAEKQELINEQRNWLKHRDKMRAWDNNGMDVTPDFLKEEYIARLFYIQEDKFILTYAKDNSTCNTLIDILKDDLDKNKDINLSRISEFNWVDWENIQDEAQDRLFISYFDINNDGVNEATFKGETQYHYQDMLGIKYTLKENGDYVKNFTSEIHGYSKYSAVLQKGINKDETNNGFGVYHSPKDEYENGLYSEMIDPEPYPFKLNDTYYIAIFGTKEYGYQRGMIPFYTMPNNGNRINLVKYNDDNKIETICIIERVNSNTRKYLKNLK